MLVAGERIVADEDWFDGPYIKASGMNAISAAARVAVMVAHGRQPVEEADVNALIEVGSYIRANQMSAEAMFGTPGSHHLDLLFAGMTEI
jgi:hypothetical protein